METDNQTNNRPWLWKKGQSGNPAGRPKGKTMKEWAKDYLMAMTDEERDEFMNGIPKETVWKMAEGNPSSEDKVDVTSKGDKVESALTSEVIALAKEKLKEKLTDDQRGTTTSETGDTVLP